MIVARQLNHLFQMQSTLDNTTISPAINELEKSIFRTLRTYSNVHRGSGHYSIVTTHLYDKAREIVLEHLGLNKLKYVLIFCSLRRSKQFIGQVGQENVVSISSHDIGLSLGVVALAIKKKALPAGPPIQTGGGTTKLIGRDWIIWADNPDKFEAGTPAIVNIIAFAKSLMLLNKYGESAFLNSSEEEDVVSTFESGLSSQKPSGPELLRKIQQEFIILDHGVPTLDQDQEFINFDNSASTPTFNSVWETFRESLTLDQKYQKEIISKTKAIVLDFLGADQKYDVLFTSNTTEAINLAVENFMHDQAADERPVVINTLLEHSSNDLPWRSDKFDLVRLDIDEKGFVDLQEIESLINKYNIGKEFGNQRVRLIAISGASNVLGSCNDIKSICEIAHKYDVKVLVDGAQLIAHRKMNLQAIGVDYFAFSAHKIYAPFGSGGLVMKKELISFSEDELEEIKDSGQENVAGIAALGMAMQVLQSIGMDNIQNHETKLTKMMLDGMGKIDGVKIYGVQSSDDPDFKKKLGVIPFGVKGMESFHVAHRLSALSGIGVRYGCHCAHLLVKHMAHIGPGLEKFQRVIQKLFPKLRLPGVVRASIGIENTEAEVDRFLSTLKVIAATKYKSTPKNKKTSYATSRSFVKNQIQKYAETAEAEVY